MKCGCGFESDDRRLFLANGITCKACYLHDTRRRQHAERIQACHAKASAAQLQALFISPGLKFSKRTETVQLSITSVSIRGKL